MTVSEALERLENMGRGCELYSTYNLVTPEYNASWVAGWQTDAEAIRTVLSENATLRRQIEETAKAAGIERTENERLRAAIPEWRPIETAPKDGRSVLVYCDHGQYVAAYETVDIEWWHVYDNKHGPFPLRGSSPTHWTPLPTPPAPRPA